MPNRVISPVLTLLLLLLALSASAEGQPEPDWGTVETVQVQARPGPAVWHVTRGESEVWILGMAGALPKGMDWNKQYLSELLDGARTIIMPPRGNAGILEIGWFLLTHPGILDMSLPRGRTLQAMVPEPVWTHFLTVVTAIGDTPDRYKTDTPFGAMQRLNSASNKHSNLAGNEPMDTINKLARDKKVPEQPTFRFEVIPIAEEFVKLTPEQQLPCFAEAVEDVDRLSQHAAAAGAAWAVGDIKGVKAHFAESRTNDCMDGLVHSLGDVDQKRVAAFTDAIDEALNKPGKTIVVMGIGPLLRKGGVLEQLEARHMTVEGPAE